jgi:hypothetical protein
MTFSPTRKGSLIGRRPSKPILLSISGSCFKTSGAGAAAVVEPFLPFFFDAFAVVAVSVFFSGTVTFDASGVGAIAAPETLDAVAVVAGGGVSTIWTCCSNSLFFFKSSDFSYFKTLAAQAIHSAQSRIKNARDRDFRRTLFPSLPASVNPHPLLPVFSDDGFDPIIIFLCHHADL